MSAWGRRGGFGNTDSLGLDPLFGARIARGRARQTKYNFARGSTLEQTQPEFADSLHAPPTASLRRFALDMVETLVLAGLLFLAINAVSARVRVDGTSMLPTLQDGEFVLVNRLEFRFTDVERGDIIVFHYPQRPDEELIKRVIALPGEFVQVEGGTVRIDGKVLDEGYVAARALYSGSWRVPDGYLFVLGDNRNNSSDSHQWGMLPLDHVIGRALLIYWPPPLWGVIEHGNSLALVRTVGLR